MSRYLLIESRDLFDSRDSESFLDLSARLAKKGEHVILFLVQNAVMALRKGGSFQDKIRELLDRNVEIYADNFSLNERAIHERDCVGGILITEMDQLIETLMQTQTKAIWH